MSGVDMTRFGGGRMAVAMSGGVDSTMAAVALLEAGCAVIGLTAIMTREVSRCCAPDDVAAAARVAAALGFPHETVDVCAVFEREIIGDFVDTYLAGRTPSPCLRCNPRIKFGALLAHARARGARGLATGHYARIEPGPGGAWLLRKGVDAAKDQSYFLARLDQSQLARACFPLGDRCKCDVEAEAARRGLVRPGRRESMEVCFVPDGDHGHWIDVRSLAAPGPGDIVDRRGTVVGRHAGIHHYTVGQRKGLGLALGRPVYVVAIDAGRNRLVVGDHAEAFTGRMRVDDVAWIAGHAPALPFRCRVRVRYGHRETPATVTPAPAASVHVTFDEPQFAVAPGQGAVFYDGETVLGGGWIAGPPPEGAGDGP